MSLWVWCVFRIHVFVLSTFPSFYTPWPFLCHGLQKKTQPFALINRNCDLKFFVFANQYDLIREKKNNVTVLTYRVVRCSESVEFRKGNSIKRSYINDLHLINIPVERESNYSKNQGNYRRSVTLSVFLFFGFSENTDSFFAIDIMHSVLLHIYFGTGKIDIYISLIKMNLLKALGAILEHHSAKFIRTKIF